MEKHNVNNTYRYGIHYLIKNLAVSLFSIFIPIYLYANGFSLVQVGIFYFCQEIFNLFFTYILYRKIYSLGIKNTLIIATIFQVLLLAIIYNYLTPTYLFLLVLSIIRGFHDSFYWGANEVIMVHLSGKSVGKFLGKWNFVVTLLQIIIIPLSAYILDHTSSFWLIVLSIILLLISVIPLIKMRLLPLEKNIIIPLKRLITSKENQYIAIISHLNEFLTKVGDTIIPIYIFIVFTNYFSVGIVGTISIIGSAFYSYFVGKHSEENNKRRHILFANMVALLVCVFLFIIIKSTLLLYFLIALISFFRLGIYLSSTVGINKLCLISDCYARKIFGRMSENVSGIIIGVIITLSGFIGFKSVFLIVGIYTLLTTFVIYHFREYI